MGQLRGHQLQPREIAELAYDVGWTDAKELVVAVAVCLAESQGYDRAFNDNLRDGVVVSRDVGLWEISIPADKIGTSTETNLYSPEANADAAYELYERRDFQPWAAYNSGVYLHDSYCGRACAGVANFLGEKLLAMPVPDKADGTPYVHGFTTPICNFQFRLVECLTHVQRAAKLLGWQAAPKVKVDAVQGELGRAQVVAKNTLPGR